MTEIINPGMIVSKVLFTKKKAQTYSGYAVRCELVFYNGPTIYYDVEHHIELFDENYLTGIYEWDGEKFIQIENWEK